MIIARSQPRPEKSVVRRLVDIQRIHGGYDQLSGWEYIAPDPPRALGDDDFEVHVVPDDDTEDDQP
jgi:hypothetical protein